jgi:cobaltochelatase CobN
MALTAWGTSNMRTGGDDIAQALALIGAKPVWDPASRRVTGYEIIPLAMMNRPRVDVTLRISGFFRDAFPDQIALFDRAVRAVARWTRTRPTIRLPRGTGAKCARLDRNRHEDDAERPAGLVPGVRLQARGLWRRAAGADRRRGWTDRADLAEAFSSGAAMPMAREKRASLRAELFEQRLLDSGGGGAEPGQPRA